MRLQNKVAVVTASTRGIGAAIVRDIHKRRCKGVYGCTQSGKSTGNGRTPKC